MFSSWDRTFQNHMLWVMVCLLWVKISDSGFHQIFWAVLAGIWTLIALAHLAVRGFGDD